MAASMIVVHNYPSGDPMPSPDNIVVTRAIAQAGKLLDIETLDNLIIDCGQFVSLKERGLGFGGSVSEIQLDYGSRRFWYTL